MSLRAFGVPFAVFRGPVWVQVVVGIAAVALVAWQTWEERMGNDRPALKAAVGIVFSFLAGMIVEQGIGLLRFHASSYRWILDFLLGLASLVISIFYISRRKAPRNFIEWLNERAKPPMMFDKKDD